jgi:hypothetical protein
MRVILRSILTWALAFALPMQGVAAHSMMFCGPGHHGAGAAAQVHEAHQAREAHDQHAHQDHHEVALPRLAAEEAVTASSDPTGVEAHAAAQSKCSVCAACCMGTALIQSAVAMPVVRVASIYPAAAFEPYLNLASGALERPPRHLLA